VDVEQIVGRVLRQPYARRQEGTLLNNSYVLASSNNFIATLDKIVKGLNQAGFSEKDVRARDATAADAPAVADNGKQRTLPGGKVDPGAETGAGGTPAGTTNGDNDWPETLPGSSGPTTGTPSQVVREIIDQTVTENRQYEERAQEAVAENIADEVRSKMNEFGMITVFAEEAKKLRLPQFYMRVPGLSLFGREETALFSRRELLKDFRLSQADCQIDFTAAGEAYQVDIEQIGDHNYRPRFWKLEHVTREQLAAYLIALPPEGKRNQLALRLYELIGNIAPLKDQEVKGYVRRILEGMNSEQLHDCIAREYDYRDKIKTKIDSLTTAYAEEVFFQWLAADRLEMKMAYELPPVIHPVEMASAIPLSLYSMEGKLNSLETKVINEIANLGNIRFWHRILEKKGFSINGFINHYPDFLVVTKRGKVLLIEAKGDDRDNSDSNRKLKLGTAWASKAGNDYRYFMVFEKNPIDGAFNLDELVKVVGQL
ncbi:MAG: hypothetical protein M0017_12645, partial [Desulfobacteraceae bacterium]|nr:hypothetical protein [Desulfobacteraceae bacterium]